MVMKPAQHGIENEPLWITKITVQTLLLWTSLWQLSSLHREGRKKTASEKNISVSGFLETLFSVLSMHRWSCQGTSPINGGLQIAQHKPDSCCRNATLPMVLNISVLTLKAGRSERLSDRWCLLFCEHTSSRLSFHSVPGDLVSSCPLLNWSQQ